MAKILRLLAGKVGQVARRLFAGRPKAPTAQRRGQVIGHRGTAVGSREPAKRDLSAENIAKWQLLSGDVVAGFIYDGKVLPVHSTNVTFAQYLHGKEQMIVGFKNGAVYRYSNVSEGEAIEFAQAQSKGLWVWDRLRVRGSRTAHQKPYVRIAGPAPQFTIQSALQTPPVTTITARQLNQPAP